MADNKKYWKIATIILSVLLVAVLIKISTEDDVSSQEAAAKALKFINDYMVKSGEATLLDVKEENEAYKITTSYQGQEIPIYVTKDGKLLFTNPINIDLPPQTLDPETPPVIEVSIDDDPVKGSDNASVTIIEFSDFQCQFCEKFYTQTLPSIEKNYIETGKVKLVYRDFPLNFHQNAQKAAEASECADEQNKFWEYHNKLFENQNTLDITSLKQYAKDLVLDASKFDNCLDSGQMASEVQKDFQDGTNYGVSGTPAFFINGRLVSGAQPFSAFKEIIDEELAK